MLGHSGEIILADIRVFCGIRTFLWIVQSTPFLARNRSFVTVPNLSFVTFILFHIDEQLAIVNDSLNLTRLVQVDEKKVESFFAFFQPHLALIVVLFQLIHCFET